MTDISPSRTGLLTQTFWRSPGSRAHCFLTCLKSSTTPSPASPSRNNAACRYCLPRPEKGRHSGANFRSSILPPVSTSVYASLWLLAESQARLEAGMKSLLLFRRALSSPTMCRFIPALSGHQFLATNFLATNFWPPISVWRQLPVLGRANVVLCRPYRDSILLLAYPALPCRALDCPVPSGLVRFLR